MRRHWLILTVLFLGCSDSEVGTERQSARDRESSLSESGLVQLQDAKNDSATDNIIADTLVNNSSNAEAVEMVGSEVTSATRKELDEYIANFKSTSAWTYGERNQGELAGRWDLVGGKTYIEFDSGGEKGVFLTLFNGKPARGRYAISREGKIVAFAKASSDGEAIGIGSHYRLNGDEIRGPNGPQPDAVWRRGLVAQTAD
ncbi:MAG: hypothetical protein ACE361_02350 [Aureliella sp.]